LNSLKIVQGYSSLLSEKISKKKQKFSYLVEFILYLFIIEHLVDD